MPSVPGESTAWFGWLGTGKSGDGNCSATYSLQCEAHSHTPQHARSPLGRPTAARVIRSREGARPSAPGRSSIAAPLLHAVHCGGRLSALDAHAAQCAAHPADALRSTTRLGPVPPAMLPPAPTSNETRCFALHLCMVMAAIGPATCGGMYSFRSTHAWLRWEK